MLNFIHAFNLFLSQRAICLLLVLFIPAIVLAQEDLQEDEQNPDKWYQVEYIIFEHLDTDDHILRYEDTPYPKKTKKQYAHIVSSQQPASEYQYSQLEIEKMVLADAFYKLKKSRAVSILDMGAWQQTLSPEQTAPPIKIDQKVSKDRFLFGELEIRKSRYTHAELKVFLAKSRKLPYKNISTWFLNTDNAYDTVDLLRGVDKQEAENKNKNETKDSSIGESEIYYDIKYLGESRRIKESEVHYIDHPVIGAIVTIKEIDPPYQFGTNLSFNFSYTDEPNAE